jgi:lipopolysaccharide heptosyltransferase II
MLKVKKILFITLSNIGDCFLTLPVLDSLKENFPEAKITVISGPRPKEIFIDNPKIEKLIIYDKHTSQKNKFNLFKELKKDNFDIVIDLRNTLFGALLPVGLRTSPFFKRPKNMHMKDAHLLKIKKMGFAVYPFRSFFRVSEKDKDYIDTILEKEGIRKEDNFIVISPGARSHVKRWPSAKFIELSKVLFNEFNIKVILVGDKDDTAVCRSIKEALGEIVIDFCAKTNINQLGRLLEKSSLVITNDSAVLHLASYLNRPVVAIFGPTSDKRYGPWSESYAVVKKEIYCRPCEKAQCRFNTLSCMQLIKVEDVILAARKILVPEYRVQSTEYKKDYKRILIVRTDRVGDVLLSTPVIKALRENYPSAYIAMMVNPYAKEIIEGNPYLDEVIVYDKEGKHKSWPRSMKFAMRLKKKRFDLAIILHPTNRVHLVTFFAGIPYRIGYNRKLGNLLTVRLEHEKHLGQKHELEYNFDLLRYLGIAVKDKSLFMPINPESEVWVRDIFAKEGIKESDKLLAIHPAASCPSKIWPVERFALVADKLAKDYGLKILVIAGPKDTAKAAALIKNMRSGVVDLSGKTSLSQLASVLRRSSLFISNDSGPVHLAVAVGTPVISIFGRNQLGLSPLRWGPLGRRDKVLHKEVGCLECLAHNCKKEFACLKAITVDEVVSAAGSILQP